METRKKMYKAGKLWVTGAVTVVSMGVGLVTQNMQVSADTTENVPATVANVNYDKEISNQQNTVNYAQKHVDMAQNDVNIAQAEANRADKIAVEATPQKISEIQNTIKNTQAQLENERIQAKKLEDQQKAYDATIEDYDNATDEYEKSCQKEVSLERSYTTAQLAVANAKTSEEQDAALKLFSEIATPYADAVADRKSKENIVREKGPAFEIAHSQWLGIHDAINKAHNSINVKEEALKQLERTLSLYKNCLVEKNKADNILKEKQKSLQDAQNYLTKQKNILNELKDKYAIDKKKKQNQENPNNSEEKTSDEKSEQFKQEKHVQIVEETKSVSDEAPLRKITNSVEINKNSSNKSKTDVVGQKVISQSDNTKTSTNSMLPKTGNSNVVTLTSLGVLISMFGLVLAKTKKKQG